MKNQLPTLPNAVRILGSNGFFYFVLGVFVLQASWIALSANYPMAFDEDFHLGVIRLYADHLLPFWGGHPIGGDAFGAVARDPSYLFHYLMSLPYHLIAGVSQSQAVQVLFLRAINIALFAWGLVLYRQLLLKTKAPAGLVHLVMLAFVLIPIVPLLGAHINYDNLIMPLTALALILTIKVVNSLDKKLDVLATLRLLAVCLFASLVKYAFLPVFAGIIGFLLWRVWRRHDYRSPAGLIKAWRSGWRKVSRPARVGLMAAIVVLSGLSYERYGINMLQYRTPVPDCGQVLAYDNCKHYGPWIRDYNLERTKGDASRSVRLFHSEWQRGMWLRSFFSLAGPTVGYQTKSPFWIPAQGTIWLALLSGAALLLTGRQLLRRYHRQVLYLFAAVTLVHVAVLWLQQYQLFLQAGKAVAINGRYLLPILPLIILIAALAVHQLVRRRAARLAIAVLVIVCLSWGGGALTFILRSNDSWYWDHPAVRSANHAVKKVVGPVTPGYNQPTQFLR